MNHRKWTVALLALAMSCAVSIANAVPVTWSLTGVVFDDGASATGTVTYDADTNSLVSWNIDVEGPPTFLDCTYSDATGLKTDPPSATQLKFSSPCPDDNRVLTLDLAQPLTNAGATSFIQVSSVESFQGGGSPRNVSEGSLVFSLPPPPPSPRVDENDTGLGIPAVNLYGDPVVLTTGATRFAAKMLDGPGHLMAFEFFVVYTSTETETGPLGRKWSHNFNWRIDEYSGGVVRVKHGDGGAEYYDAAGGGAFTPQRLDVTETLVQNVDDTYTWVSEVDDHYHFSADGKLTSIVDSNDNTFTLAYDGSNRLASVTDATSAITTFTYDGSNRVATVNYAGLQSVTFSYTGDDLSSYVEPGPRTTAFTYDVDGNMLTASFAGTQLLSNTYDGSGRVVSMTNANGTVKTIAYSTGGGGEPIATITDGNGNTHTRQFDDGSSLTTWVGLLGGTWTATHDAAGNELTVTDPLGRTTTKTYDANGNLLTDTDALGNTQSFSYDAEGNLTSSTDPLGHVMSFDYDANGNMTGFTDQNGDSMQYTYTDTGIRGMVASTIDRHGHPTAQTWTPAGELDSITNAEGETTTFSYDALGRTTSLVGPDGNAFTMGYDAAGNTTSATDALGNVITKTYNERGQLTSETLPNGATSVASYTPAGDVASITDPLGNIYAYTYDGERRVTKRTDPMGNETDFAWNAADQLTMTTDALGGTIGAIYDAVGNVTTVTDPRGNVTSFTYDATDKLLTDTDSLGNTLSNAFDSRGLLTSTTNRRGQTISYEYDPAGRRDKTTLSGGGFIFYTWEPGSHIRSLSGPGGTTRFWYDADERLESRRDELNQTVNYAYDSRGNVTSIQYPSGVVVTYQYDELSRLTQVRDWAGYTTQYTYDNVGQLTTTQLPDGSTVHHVADAAGRISSLHSVRRDGSTIFRSEHARNALGRTTTETMQTTEWPTPALPATNRTFTHNAANQLTAEDGMAFTNDADGNLVNGPVAGAPLPITYDDRNQLTTVGTDTYNYDSTGLRISAVIDGQVRRYAWDTNRDDFARLLEERDHTGAIVARYVHGIGLISREERSRRTLFYHYDTRGSTVAMTNVVGTIVERYAYDPYGKVVSSTSTDNPFTYNGRDGVLDDGNGLYFTRVRAYSPGLMRFVQPDMIARGHLMSTQTLNRYLYVRGNPVELVDPRGDVPAAVVAFGVGAGVGFGGQVAANVASGNTDFSFGKNGLFYNTPGAALGGGITGALDVYAIAAGPLGLAGSSALGSAVGNATNQFLNIYAFGNQDKFDPIDFGIEVGTSAALGLTVGFIGKYADEADPSGRVFNLLANHADEVYEVLGTGVVQKTRVLTKAALGNKVVSNVIVRGSRAAIEHHRTISRATSPYTSTAWNWSKNSSKSVGNFFSSNKKGKSKRNKAVRSVTKKAKSIGKKIKGWF